MIQILGIIPEGALFRILVGLFSTVARIYDVMLTLTGYYKEDGVPDNFIITTSNVMTTMYTLAGVFMLFRITISMINLLIDPDKVNDSQVGPGKLVTRVITSIAMLLLFVPDGLIFSKNPDDPGILMRIESALLAKDGLIHNLIPEINGEQSNFSKPNNKHQLLIDNAYAAVASDGSGTDTDKFDCYFIEISTKMDKAAKQAQKSDASLNGPNSDDVKIQVSGVMHLTFYNSKDVGKGHVNAPKYMFSYNSDSTTPYTSLNNKNLKWASLNNTWPGNSNCPNHIYKKSNPIDISYIAKDSSIDNWKTKGKSGWYGGWHSLEAMQKDVQEAGNMVATGSSAIADLLGISSDSVFLNGVQAEAVDFAQSALSSFVICDNDSPNSECNGKKSRMLLTKADNKAVVTELNKSDSSMTLDFIIGVVAGIGLVVWIAFLCVDVIIRRFKLILLEIMAPIPIICYADPKDDIFNKWGKMYISTYLELFLKLIAISVAILLLKQVQYATDGSGLLTLFYIAAILLFAKMIPDMISKIFGIDMSSATFGKVKDMYQRALGMGVGGIGTHLAGKVSGALAYRAWKNSDARDNMLGDAAAKQRIDQLKKELAAAREKKKKTADDRKQIREMNKELNQLRRDKNLRGDDATVFANTVVKGGFSGFFQGMGAGYNKKPFAAIGSVRDANAKYAEEITTSNDNIGPKEAFITGIIKNFKMGKPNDEANVQLDNVKAMQEVTKNLQGFADDFESAIKKIPELDDLAKLNSQGLISNTDFKNILSAVGEEMNNHRTTDKDGNSVYDGNHVIELKKIMESKFGTGYELRDKDGQLVQLRDFKAGAYAKGVDTAEQKMQAYIDAIATNESLNAALKDKGLYKDKDGNPIPEKAEGFELVQNIKLSTYDVMRELDKEQITIENSAEYRKNKAIEERFYNNK